jgi:hypothetical protein
MFRESSLRGMADLAENEAARIAAEQEYMRRNRLPAQALLSPRASDQFGAQQALQGPGGPGMPTDMPSSPIPNIPHDQLPQRPGFFGNMLKPVKALKPHGMSIIEGALAGMATPGSGPTALAQAGLAGLQAPRLTRMQQLEQELAIQKAQTDRMRAQTDADYKDATLGINRDKVGISANRAETYAQGTQGRIQTATEANEIKRQQALESLYAKVYQNAEENGRIPPSWDQFMQHQLAAGTASPEQMTPIVANKIAVGESQVGVNDARAQLLKEQYRGLQLDNNIAEQYGMAAAEADLAYRKAMTDFTKKRADRIGQLSNELSPGQRAGMMQLDARILADPAFKDFAVARAGFDAVQAGLRGQSGFDDISIINSIQRMIDPGATVREGDVTLLVSRIPAIKKYAEMSAINGKQVWNLQAMLLEGRILPDSVKEDISDLSIRLMAQRQYRVDAEMPRYLSMAAAMGVPPELVRTAIGVTGEAGPIEKSGAVNAPAKGSDNLDAVISAINEALGTQ